MRQFKPIKKISLPLEDVFIRLGSRLNTELDDSLKARIADIANMAEKIFTPKTIVAFGNTQISDDSVIFDTGFRIYSQAVAKLFKNSFKGYGFLVTVGAGISEKIETCMTEKNIFDAVVFDACGSVGVEIMAGYTYETISEIETGNGNKVTKRFSPGYLDWDISAQEYFLHWLGAESIDVGLTDSYQMMPEKSVSAILGVEKGCRERDIAAVAKGIVVFPVPPKVGDTVPLE